eukprot:gene4838-6053_t
MDSFSEELLNFEFYDEEWADFDSLPIIVTSPSSFSLENNNSNIDISAKINFAEPRQTGIPESSAIVTRARPKRVRIRKWYPRLPRVLKIDIRRKYPTMVMNVLNACEPNLLCRFLSQFCLPDCQIEDSIVHPITGAKTVVFTHTGLEQILAVAQTSPSASDTIFQLHSACIQQSNMYSGSKLLLKVSVRTSFLAKFFEPAAQHHQSRLLMLEEVMALLERKFQAKDRPMGSAGLLGDLTVSLDEAHRFRKLEMVADFFLS